MKLLWAPSGVGALIIWLALTAQGTTAYECYRAVIWLNGCQWSVVPVATPCEAQVWGMCTLAFKHP